MIKAIIFDFGGVVGNDPGWLWLQEVHPQAKKRRKYIQNLAEKSDTAEISSDEFAQLLAEETDIPADKIWPAVLKKTIVNEDILHLVGQLKKNYSVGMLTNFNEWFNDIVNRYKLGDNFDPIIVSYKYKVVKPQPEAFRIALSNMNIQPYEAIFIDDKRRNVIGAKKVGLNSVVFTTTDNLVKKLKKIGVQF